MSELKPCPFCGGGASIKRSHDDDMTLWIKIECNKCGATTRGNWCREDCPLFYQERRDEWNTRTPQWQPNAEEVLMKLKRLWNAGWFTSDDRNCITFNSIMDSLPTPPKEQP